MRRHAEAGRDAGGGEGAHRLSPTVVQCGAAGAEWPAVVGAGCIAGGLRGEIDEEDVDIEDEKIEGLFCIHSCHVAPHQEV